MTLEEVIKDQRDRLVGVDLLATYIAEQLLAMEKAAQQADGPAFAQALSEAKGAVARLKDRAQLLAVAREQPRDPRKRR